MNILPIKRALISVYDKSGLVTLAQRLLALNIELLSTGGTSQHLRDASLPHRTIETMTGLPAMLDGRVKTLHPMIHAGILAKRDQHAKEIAEHHIEPIDLVIINFYPFAQALKQHLTFDQLMEYIDIGGPTMVRAAAKNCQWVGVITQPEDYAVILTELECQQGLSFETRRTLAQKAFTLTAQYDAIIQQYFENDTPAPSETLLTQMGRPMTLALTQPLSLRYGENPHQKACAYTLPNETAGILSAKHYQGKPLSFNNILDFDAALNIVCEFNTPTAVIVKHGNPCGVATHSAINQAYQAAYQADALSAFGGVIALNRTCTLEIAQAITQIFVEGVLAPDYTKEALALLSTKPLIRILALPILQTAPWDMKGITGGLLLQERDQHSLDKQPLTVVTQAAPTPAILETMQFAWKVIKHIKSNAILIAKDHVTIGIGAGQVSRIDAVDLAIRKAGNPLVQTVLASDAFFPFRDNIDRIAQTPIRAIIQPGGSKRDAEIIAACNEHHIAMVFTGIRCFKH